MTALMIVPIWAGASFFSIFWPDGRHAAGFVTKMLVIKPFFVCGPLVTTDALRGRKSFSTAALKVDFTRPNVSARTDEQFCLAGGCAACS